MPNGPKLTITPRANVEADPPALVGHDVPEDAVEGLLTAEMNTQSVVDIDPNPSVTLSVTFDLDL